MRNLAPWLLAAASVAAWSGALESASAEPRRVADRMRLPARSELSRPVSADLQAMQRRFEEIRVRTLFGDDWDEVVVQTVDGDVESLLTRHGGSWRSRGLGRDALRKPGVRRSMEWYLDLWADPAVRSLEPNPRAVHPGCRQMSIDILESGTQLVPDLVSQSALEPTSAEPLACTGVVVAIVDSGVAALPELADELLPSIDMLHPRGPTVVRDAEDLAESAGDANGHGTAMATLVASVARGALIQPVRVVGADCTGTAFDLATGLTAAADAGARVVLVSLSTPVDSPIVRRSVADLLARNVVVVAAAGNDGALEYPAAYPGVLAVTAVDDEGWPPDFAPQGSGVSLAAPGVEIEAVGPEAPVEMTGTSPAAAVVAGAAARAAYLAPGGSGDELRALVLAAVRAADPDEPDEPQAGALLGAGLLDFTSLK